MLDSLYKDDLTGIFLNLVSRLLFLLAWMPAAFPVAFCPCTLTGASASANGCPDGRYCGCGHEESPGTCRGDSEHHNQHEACENDSFREESHDRLVVETTPIWFPHIPGPEKTPATCPLCGQLPPASLFESGSEIGSQSGWDSEFGLLGESFLIGPLPEAEQHSPKSQIFCFEDRGPLFLIHLSILI